MKSSPTTAMKLKKKKVIDEEWDESNVLIEKQIRSLFSRCKNDRTKRGQKAMKEIEISDIVKDVVHIGKKDAVKITITRYFLCRYVSHHYFMCININETCFICYSCLM